MKVSIPRQVVDEIMDKYHCSQEAATQAYLTASNRANDAYTGTLDEILGSGNRKDGNYSVQTFTPRQIKQHLDKYVIGQEEYKKRICIAASYHFAMIKHLQKLPNRADIKRFRKKNTIIAGPSGSGKTYCVEVLGDLLQVPTLIIDATDYTEAGYVGKSADDMVRELVEMAPGTTREEQGQFINHNGGIIFIDEIDKKAKESGLVGHDISREGFQRSVLKLIERKLVSIDNPYSAASQIREAMERQKGTRSSDKQDKMLGTENILFILGGSFERNVENLEDIVKKRIEHKGRVREDGSLVIRGFDLVSDEESNKKAEKYQNYFKLVNAEDYIRFGLLPELVGRVPIRTFVNLLSKNDLIRIMVDTEDSILAQYKLEFQLFGVDLEIQQDAIDYVASAGENKKTGARALVSVWENILTEFQFELPGSNFTKLVVDRDLCKRPKDALLRILKKSPFVDFIESFKNEYGIEHIFDEDVQNYIENIAKQENMEVSKTISRLLSGASALNYMNHEGPFTITTEMLIGSSFFDDLFTQWYDKQLEGRSSS